MRSKLLFTSLLALTINQNVISQTESTKYTEVKLTMGPDYENRVFFDLSSNTTTSQNANTWDIAFFRNNRMSKGIRVNDSKNIVTYQVSSKPEDFDAINPADKANWGSPIYNPDKTENIQDGAFDVATLLPSGGFNYGWGSYDITTHKIVGKVTFVLDYGNNNYFKFFINEYYGGYTFKYAKWNGSSWDATQTKTIENGQDDSYFNYFSFDTGEKVLNLEPPKANWDLMFTRYYTFYANIMMYKLSGVIQSPNVSIATVQPETQETSTFTAPEDSKYSKIITTIGHSWKPISGVYNDVVYYVKEGSKYYRMYFYHNGGATTGDMFFKYLDISSTLSVTDFGKKGSFGIYPNPTKEDKKINLILDVKHSSSSRGNVEIFDLSGKKVHETSISNQVGFSAQEINLNKLSSGVYLVKITYDGQTETKKLIIK